MPTRLQVWTTPTTAASTRPRTASGTLASSSALRHTVSTPLARPTTAIAAPKATSEGLRPAASTPTATTTKDVLTARDRAGVPSMRPPTSDPAIIPRAIIAPMTP